MSRTVVDFPPGETVFTKHPCTGKWETLWVLKEPTSAAWALPLRVRTWGTGLSLSASYTKSSAGGNVNIGPDTILFPFNNYRENPAIMTVSGSGTWLHGDSIDITIALPCTDWISHDKDDLMHLGSFSDWSEDEFHHLNDTRRKIVFSNSTQAELDK